MFEIVNQNSPRFFTLTEAQDILPFIHRVTEEAEKTTKELMRSISALPDKKSSKAEELQDRINNIINKWQNKLERLGAKPKGLWLADFDSGSGYYCWKFPEVKILFKHGYQDGFTGRILIASDEESHENCPSPN